MSYLKTLLVLAATTVAMTFVATAQGHVIQLSEVRQAGVSQQDICGGVTYTVMDYRKYAKRVYRRESVSAGAQRRMRAMHICQQSWRARKAVGRHHGRYKREREARKCSNSNPIACIYEASRKYGTSSSHLISCALSEGGLSATSYNRMNEEGSSAGGVFQFMKATFDATIRRMGLRPKTWLSAKWQAHAAAWKFKHDGTGEWTGAGC